MTMPDAVNYGALRLFWDVLTCLALVILYYARMMDSKREKNSQGLEVIKTDHLNLGLRVQRVEDTLSGLPSHKELNNLRQELNTLKVEMASLTTKIEDIDRKLHTIHEFLLNKEGRA